MKNISIFLFLFIGITNFAQIVNIPDANFKTALLNNSLINTNGDNEIQISEAESFTGEIDCNYQSISDLTGIEKFINITILDCSNNSLTNLDISQNTALINLECWNNQLANLDVSKNAVLTVLHCGENQISELQIFPEEL